jgi:hypothetical protein
MPKEQLNRADIGAGFEQMYRERVSQRMGRDGFENATPLVRLLAFLFHSASGDGVVGTIARKQPVAGRFTRHHARKISSSFGESIT